MKQAQPDADLPALREICDAAREAGALALRYFGNAPRQWMKPGNSPVTEADLAIDKMLHDRLRRAHPSFGWLSEEIEDDGSRLNKAPTFIVDPIDGTRGFMSGSKDWVVSIALVRDGRPEQGVLFNPVQGFLLYAERAKGAFVELDDGSIHRLTPSGKSELEGALLAFPGPDRASYPFVKKPKIASLALRIAHVAWGKLDGCMASSNAKHWDIAAADLIAQEAGVPLTDQKGALARYDTQAVAHPALFCGSQALRTDLMAFLHPQH